MTNRWLILIVLAGCPPKPPDAPPRRADPPPPAATAYVEYEMHGEIGGGSDTPVPTLDQPPHVKMKLGHFRNNQFNIGVTVDLTQATDSVADIDPAKLRFDGDAKVWLLEGRHGGSGRIDYVRERDRVMLEVESNGRMRVYITDPETDRGSGPIDLYRDADAEPLPLIAHNQGNP